MAFTEAGSGFGLGNMYFPVSVVDSLGVQGSKDALESLEERRKHLIEALASTDRPPAVIEADSRALGTIALAIEPSAQ